jgi:hypothetical protein
MLIPTISEVSASVRADALHIGSPPAGEGNIDRSPSPLPLSDGAGFGGGSGCSIGRA